MALHSPAAALPAADAAGGASRAVHAIHVGEMRQLFNAMDPAPFRERDLDPAAVAYILDWGRETRAGQPLGLVVRLSREAPTAESCSQLGDAFHAYFRQRAVSTRRQLRHLFRVGRISLVIGLAFLASAIVVGETIAGFIASERYALIVQESFVIGGWVALWRPLEIFLYDWWPIRAEARLHDRLAEMEVSVVAATQASPSVPHA